MGNRRVEQPTEMSRLVAELCPIEGPRHVAEILRIPRRAVDRMCSGYSTTPPRILELLREQIALAKQVEEELESLLDDSEDDGCHPLVLRYLVRKLGHAERFEGTFDPLGGPRPVRQESREVEDLDVPAFGR